MKIHRQPRVPCFGVHDPIACRELFRRVTADIPDDHVKRRVIWILVIAGSTASIAAAIFCNLYNIQISQ